MTDCGEGLASLYWRHERERVQARRAWEIPFYHAVAENLETFLADHSRAGPGGFSLPTGKRPQHTAIEAHRQRPTSKKARLTGPEPLYSAR